MRRLTILALALLSAALAPATGRAQEPLTVVELFTSQGCSSCPPADRLLGELAQMKGVLPLSLHVDYWDYLGWRDPFASARTTERQRSYARRFGLSYVYTPQMVIDGHLQMAGTNRRGILNALNGVADRPRLDVSLRRSGADTVAAHVGAGAVDSPADIFLVLFDHKHTTDVLRGENAGRTLSDVNVVRGFRRIGEWRGDAITLPVAVPPGEAGDACAVIVQMPGTGAILGAARLDFAAASPQRQ